MKITSNFLFLQEHDEQLSRLGMLAERYFAADPNTCLLKLRQLSELLAQLLAARSGILSTSEEPQYDLLRRLNDFGVLPREIAQLFTEIRRNGNAANHALAGDHRAALNGLKFAWQISLWFHRTFANPGFKSGPFIPPSSPKDESAELKTELATLRQDLQTYEASHHETNQRLLEMQVKLRESKDAEGFWEQMALETEQAKIALEQRLAAAQQAAAAQPKVTLTRVSKAATSAASSLQLDEAATRELIDEQLRQAGWEADTQNLRYSKDTRPVKGRNIAIAEWPAGSGPADYVLFVGMTPLAVVEAKRKNLDVSAAIQQAKRYSRDILASHFDHPDVPWGPYRIPFAFSANGRPFLRQLSTRSGIWFCDLRLETNISRALDGWYSPEGLTALLKRDEAESNKRLAAEPFPYGFPLREYQKEAIRSVENSLARGRPQMLLAMATGTGKTKTCIALIYRFLKTQRFRRILFLVDRSALGEQAADNFKDTRMENLITFADTFGIKEIDEKTPDTDTCVHIATVQGMVQRIIYSRDGTNPPKVDQYDCIVVDECHRGYLLDRELSEAELSFRDQEDYISKYRRVLDYFDAIKIGLTATPALHTTEIFGEPIYTYPYRRAVIEGFLTDYEPPIQIHTELSTEGIRWRNGEEIKLYNTRSQQIELFRTPDDISIDIDGFNRKVITESFNKVVCQHLARELDPNSLQKTLIFCANDAHCDLVVTLLKEALKEQYGTVEDDAVIKITGAAAAPLKLIRRFKNERNPNIAVTVDLLTTGIDVPAICNLVFLRRVSSRILFDQMLGRATRLCPEVGKVTFRIFDAVRLFDAMRNQTAMVPVVNDPKISFTQLTGELTRIADEQARTEVLDQFIAKLQGKKRHLGEKALQQFQVVTGMSPGEFIQHVRTLPSAEIPTFFTGKEQLGPILDRRGEGPLPPLYISEHPDQIRSIERGYGNGQRPADYIESFTTFINANRDIIPALTAVLTRPRDLTRKQLRELLFELDKAGFTETNLDTAWREMTNQDIAARIVGYIRLAASGEKLVPYRERVDQALQETLASRPWTGPQRDWLKRIAAQTQANLLVDRDAIDDPDLIFKREGGGFQRLDRIFDGNLSGVLASFNEAVMHASA